MSTATLPAVLDALTSALSGLSALTGVSVYSAPSGDSGARECLEVREDIETTEEALAMGGQRSTTDEIPYAIFVARPGAGERVIKDVRDRAYAILAAVETYLNDNPTIGGTCLSAELSGRVTKQGYMPEGRVCQVDFTVTVESVVNP